MSSGGEQRRGGDPVRLLALRSEVGYVDRVDKALPDEPEAISESEQQMLSLRARRDWLARRRREWNEARAMIDSALDGFVASVGGDPTIRNSVRAVRRSADAVGRRL